MKIKLLILAISFFSLSELSFANVSRDHDIVGAILATLDVQRGILSTDKSIEGLMVEINKGVIGHSGWGTYHYHEYQSYGEGARDWSSIMQMAEKGYGAGDLGNKINQIYHEFPIDRNVINQAVKDPATQKFYALQSQTILATRAASQLDYDKIQSQIDYQQMLQQQIEKTHDIKAAMDLSNRIQVESNLIHLAMLRQLALSNQQHALTSQAVMNDALLNANFLKK